MTHRIAALFGLALLLCGLSVCVSAAEVAASTETMTVSSIYTVEKLRDPFIKSGAGPVASAPKEFTMDNFNIHNLLLKGLMKDAGTDYALLVDKEFGVSFVLRKGKLYDIRNKPLPGISGTINVKAKQVNVITADKDVQVLRLGEDEELSE